MSQIPGIMGADYKNANLRFKRDIYMDSFEEALDKNDLRKLNRLIFPDSPILTASTTTTKKTPLHIICESPIINIAFLGKLIKLGINVDAQTYDGSTPLHSAVNSTISTKSFLNNMHAIKILLKKGANPYIRNEHGLSPILLALFSNKIELVEAFLETKIQLSNVLPMEDSIRLGHLLTCLINKSSEWTVTDTNYSMLLQFLVLQENEELFEYVAEKTVFDPNAINEEETTLLQVVSEYGSPRCIKALINSGADIHFTNNYNIPSLFIAIKSDRPENVQCLLDYGASLTEICTYQSLSLTPLHFAVYLENIKIVKILVENGADINCLVDHVAPLHFTCDSQNLEIAQYLLVHGANINLKNNLGLTALDIECQLGSFEGVKLLLAHKARLDSSSVSSLHYAARAGSAAIMRLLLEAGADINLQCLPDDVSDLVLPVPRTALEYAIMHIESYLERKDIMKIITDYKIDVNLPDPVRGETLLHLACFSNKSDSYRRSNYTNVEMIKFLLECNADVNALDYQGLTPLNHVVYNYRLMGVTPNYSWIPCKHDLNLLVAFIVKMIFIKNCVVEANLQLLKTEPVLRAYEECMEEMMRMERNICDDMRFSYVSILKMDTHVLGRVLSNNDIIIGNRDQLRDEFPIYADDLEACIGRALSRYPLIQSASDFFNRRVGMKFKDAFLEICQYLSVDDLNNFVQGTSTSV